MRCPYCAEEIQDAAVLCRYCGARKQEDGQWREPGVAPPRAPAPPPGASPPPWARKPGSHRKGAFTIKSAGALIAISAVGDMWLTSPFPLFGGVHGGALAVIYHLFYVCLFLGMGIGLVQGKPWGYYTFFAGTAVYSLEKILFLFDSKAQQAYLDLAGGQQLNDLGFGDMHALFDEVLVLATVGILLSWWGLALYIRWRRPYFFPPEGQGEPAQG